MKDQYRCKFGHRIWMHLCTLLILTLCFWRYRWQLEASLTLSPMVQVLSDGRVFMADRGNYTSRKVHIYMWCGRRLNYFACRLSFSCALFWAGWHVPEGLLSAGFHSTPFTPKGDFTDESHLCDNQRWSRLSEWTPAMAQSYTAHNRP